MVFSKRVPEGTRPVIISRRLLVTTDEFIYFAIWIIFVAGKLTKICGLVNC